MASRPASRNGADGWTRPRPPPTVPQPVLVPRCGVALVSWVDRKKDRRREGGVMKVLVAGAGGVIGRQLLPRLAKGGHEVVGLTRSPEKAELVRALGAEPVIADALDAEQVARAVADSEPEAIVHELTALSGSIDLRHFDRSFEPTNRLRTEATDHLLSAGRAVGVKRFVAQSYAGG